MEYEKKYKEALERAKKYKLKEDLIITQDIFPELAESEDEKIRKALIKFFALSDDNADYQCCGVHYKDIVAWLEKQEQKEYGWSEESDDDAWLNDIVSKVESDLQLNKAEINWLKSIKGKLHKEIHYWTEEEIEPIISDYLRGTEHYGGMIGRLRCLRPKSLERQGEQEAWSEEDKKMLKWVTGYLENKMLNTPISEERTACKNAIAWFKKLEGEQKPTNKVEQKKLKKTKFKTEDRVIGIVSGMQYYITEVCDDHYCTESGCIIMFCAQENFELYKQKPAEWSISDFRTWQYIVSDVLTKKDGIGQYLDNGECKKIAKYMQEEWSKKLSTEQKPAWSEDDTILIDNCISLIEDIPGTEEEQNWLKSLKERYAWKPSDEQMDALLVKIPIENSCNKVDNILKSLYSDLKKLK